MRKLDIQVQRLPHGLGLALPDKATSGSAGIDLLAAVRQPLSLAPRAYGIIPTGIALALPSGYEGQVRPRSGLAAKYGVTILNSPGTIDADYRGEVKVVLINHGAESFIISRGMRIAQLLIAPIYLVEWQESLTLMPSERGSNGFGSTGK